MSFVLYFILLGVFSASEMQPVRDTKSVLMKLPKEITNGTIISITGETKNVNKLSVALSGDNTDEECRIDYDPSNQNIKATSNTENKTTYNIDHSRDGPLPVSLNISARAVTDETENHFLDFKANFTESELLPRCEFK